MQVPCEGKRKLRREFKRRKDGVFGWAPKRAQVKHVPQFGLPVLRLVGAVGQRHLEWVPTIEEAECVAEPFAAARQWWLSRREGRSIVPSLW